MSMRDALTRQSNKSSLVSRQFKAYVLNVGRSSDDALALGLFLSHSRRIHRRKLMNNVATATTSRLKGLIWVVGVVAAIFTLISLAPVISHLG
jgi:hypothetical protein